MGYCKWYSWSVALVVLKLGYCKWYSWSIALSGAETWKLWTVDQKYLESFHMWC